MCGNDILAIVFIIQLFLAGTVHVAPNESELYEGNTCTLENGSAGVCKKLPDCQPRVEEVEKGIRESTSMGRCGFDDFVEIVCCPFNITQKFSRRPADAACEQYDNEITIDDSKPDDLAFHIFGGVKAQSGEFPYMAALGYENDNFEEDPSPIIYSCGGSLISSQHVLTAAHCVNNIDEKVPVEVRLGNEDTHSTATNVQRIPISDIISHPRYKRSANYNDVAILKLKSKVQLSNTVKPICLQTKPVSSMSVTSRTPLVVIGWGATSFDTERSVKLMRTPSLSIVDREECAKMYKGFRKLPNGIDDSMICVTDTNRTRGADACQGDSGGPLLMLTESGDSVIGITAFGQTCGGPIPGVYTAIYTYLDWIEEHVWGTNVEEVRTNTGILNITITF